MPLAEAKGNNLIVCLEMLGKEYGAAITDKVLGQLDPDLGQALLNRAVVHSGWYPIKWYDNLLRAIVYTVTGDGEQALRRLGRAGVERDLRGIYSVLVRMITPSMLMSWAPRTFGQYYRGGKAQVVDSVAGHTTMEYLGWQGFTPRLWNSVLGGSLACLTACGAKTAQGVVIGVSEDTADCRMQFSWHA